MIGRKIGVFICHCGGNISDYVDVEKVRAAVENEPGVALAKTNMFTCSDAAQREIISDIQEHQLDGLVIASCSPKLHLFTFRAMAQRAGINPYQYIQVNLREQCSWTHTNDQAGATAKGIALVKAGIARALLAQPLSALRVETIRKVLVIGAGAAGLRAALALSDLGIHTYLIESQENVGGWTAKFGAMFPQNRAGREMIAALLDQVKTRANIELFTQARLLEKSGHVGDFTVKIQSADQTREFTVGAIIVATGFDVYQPQKNEYGADLPGVLTLPRFRELLDQGTGPLQWQGRTVRNIAYIYCVGSRQRTSEQYPQPNTYCSRYCCTAAVHTSLLVHARDPQINQYHVFRQLRTYGKYERLYEQALQAGAVFLRCADEQPAVVSAGDNGLRVTLKDELTASQELELDVDLVVLVTGMVPRQNPELSDTLKLPLGKDGFFNEIHPKLRPVETVVDGVFIAGAAQGPKTLAESVAASMAAVAKSAGLLMKGYVDLEPLVATVNPELCTWCDLCTQACPYDAVTPETINGKQVARINAVLCKGEGACVPICPHGAIDVQGYTDAQVKAMIDALVQENI